MADRISKTRISTSQISNNYRNQRGSNMANNKNDTTFEMLVTYLEKRYPTYSKDAITCALLKYRQQQSTLTGIPLARIEQEVLAIVAKDNDAPIISENKQEENHAKSEPEQLLLPSQYFGVHYENSDVNNVQEQKPTVASILWETFNRHRRNNEENNQASKNTESGDSCPICLESLIKEKTESFPCQHIFHRKCLEQWFAIERTCPLCRRLVIFDDEFPSLT